MLPRARRRAARRQLPVRSQRRLVHRGGGLVRTPARDHAASRRGDPESHLRRGRALPPPPGRHRGGREAAILPRHDPRPDGAGAGRTTRPRAPGSLPRVFPAARPLPLRSGPAAAGLGAADSQHPLGGSGGRPRPARAGLSGGGGGGTGGMRRLASFRSLVWCCVLVAVSPAPPPSRPPAAEDGYDPWPRYRPVGDAGRLAEDRAALTHLVVEGDSPTLRAVHDELEHGLSGLLGADIPRADHVRGDGALIAGTPATSRLIAALPRPGAAELTRAG